jgi:hypothetical protein
MNTYESAEEQNNKFNKLKIVIPLLSKIKVDRCDSKYNPNGYTPHDRSLIFTNSRNDKYNLG